MRAIGTGWPLAFEHAWVWRLSHSMIVAASRLATSDQSNKRPLSVGDLITRSLNPSRSLSGGDPLAGTSMARDKPCKDCAQGGQRAKREGLKLCSALNCHEIEADSVRKPYFAP